MAFDEITAEKQRQIPVLKRFKCRICKRYKEPTLYSNKELNNYRFKVGQGYRPTAESADLRCRVCAGGQLHELECGQCGIWKELQQFSKSARMAGGSGWCQACVLWKEALESGIVPQAAPSGDLAPDEDPFPVAQPSNNNNTIHNNVGYYSDPEAGDGSDDDDDSYPIASAGPAIPTHVSPSAQGPTAPVRASASSSSAPRASSIASSTVAMSQLSVSSNGWTTPSVRPTNNQSTNSSRAAPLQANPGNLALNMGAGPRKPSDTTTVPSMSNPYEGRASETTSQAGWSAVGGPGRTYTSFNAWDSKGVEHIQKRFFSDSRSEAGSTITSTTASSTTTTTTVRPAPPAVSNSGWAKATGRRNKQVQYNALDHQTQPRRQERTDSDDEM